MTPVAYSSWYWRVLFDGWRIDGGFSRLGPSIPVGKTLDERRLFVGAIGVF